MSSSVALELQSVSKVFPVAGGAVTALSDITLSLPKGKTSAIVGPSGSGKTTLLALAAGLDLPSTGSVFLNGVEISRMSEDERAEIRNTQVGFIFQQYQLVPSLTARENVSLPLEIAGRMPLRECRARAEELLHQVGLSDRLDHIPGQLSGGEQQRVALARAFINHPAVLFADEPTGNLDFENAARAIDLMLALTQRYQTAIILVTHDRSLADQASTVVRLAHGRIQ